MLKDHADQVAVAIGKATTFSGGSASGAYVLGLTVSEVAAFGGLIVALIGVAIQWHYGKRRDARDHAEETRDIELHKHQMRDK